MKKSFVFLLMVFLAVPVFVLAQARGRSTSARRPSASQRSSRPAPRARYSAPRVVVQSRPYVVVRPYYRSYGYGYYGGYGYGYNYGYRYGYGRSILTGLKFDLGRIDKAERKMVLDGTVFVDDFNFGVVDRYDGRANRILPLGPGTHQVRVELRDGRKFEADIDIELGRSVYLYPEFPPKP